MGNIEIKKIGTPSNNATTMRHPNPPLRALVVSSDSASRTSVLSDAVYPALLTVSMICLSSFRLFQTGSSIASGLVQHSMRSPASCRIFEQLQHSSTISQKRLLSPTIQTCCRRNSPEEGLIISGTAKCRIQQMCLDVDMPQWSWQACRLVQMLPEPGYI